MIIIIRCMCPDQQHTALHAEVTVTQAMILSWMQSTMVQTLANRRGREE
jgi:hypothetical protein